MVDYITDQIQNVLDMDAALLEDPMLQIILLTVATEYFPTLMEKEAYSKAVKKLIKYLSEEVDGLNYLMQELKYDKVIDFLKLVDEENINLEKFEIIAEIFKIQSKKASFYRVRRPSYEDVAMLMKKLQFIKPKCKEGSTLWASLVEITRVLLQKAITAQPIAELNREEAKENKKIENQLMLLDRQIKADLEFISILKQQGDLGIFNDKIAKIVLFETAINILKEKPFQSSEEADLKISLVLYAINKFSYIAEDEKKSKFIKDLVPKLHKQIYENEEFDKYLDIPHYTSLRDITKRL